MVYAASLGGLAMLNWFDFKRNPQKQVRYAALPIHYKFFCWFVVVPLFAGTVLQGVLLVVAVIAFLLAEAACVRWYRKAGML